MNKLHILNYVFSLFFVFLFSSCAIKLGYTQNTLKKIIDRGEVIIAAIEKYHKDNDEYPSDIEKLIPKYLPVGTKISSQPTDSIFDFPISFKNDDAEYLYLKYKEQASSKDPAFTGYRILVIVDPITWMDDENMWKCLLYRSSQKYPKLRLEIPKERIGKWAVVVRGSGSLFESENDDYVHFLSY